MTTLKRAMAKAPLNRLVLHQNKSKPAAQRDGKRYGRATGLRRLNFMDELLYANYERQLTDKQLADALEAEFDREDKLQPVRKYRYYFNTAHPQHGMGLGRPLKKNERLPEFGDGPGRVQVGVQIAQPRTSLARLRNRTTAKARRRVQDKPTARHNSPCAMTVKAIEGMLREVRRFTRVRSRSLRDAKLAQSDGKCEACGRDFSKILRGNGRKVLLVHHERQRISDYRHDGQITSERDLAVVCANCHMLLHVNPNRPMKLAALRKALQKR